MNHKILWRNTEVYFNGDYLAVRVLLSGMKQPELVMDSTTTEDDLRCFLEQHLVFSEFDAVLEDLKRGI